MDAAQLKYVLPTLLLACFAGIYATGLHSYGMFMWDEAGYASLARSLLRGNGFSIGGIANYYRLPVLPIMTMIWMALTGSQTDWVLKIVSLMSALSVLSLVYLVVYKVYDRATAVSATVLLGFFPQFWSSVPLLMTEMPFMIWFTGAIFFLYFSLYENPRWLYFSAIFTALALLTRYTGVLFAPIALLFLFTRYAQAPKDAWTFLRSRDFLLSAILAIVLMSPWLIRQQLTFGDALIGFFYASHQLSWYLPGVSMPWNYYLSALPNMLTVPGIALVIVGTVWAVYRKDRFALHCAAAVGVILVWLSFYRYKEPRLIMAVMPFMAVLGALAVARVLSSRARMLRHAVILFLLLLVAVPSQFAVRRALAEQRTLGYPSFLDAMKYLKQVSSPDSVIVGASRPQIAWYADRRVIDYPAQRKDLTKLPANVKWAVIVNFERGQKPYVAQLRNELSTADFSQGDALEFHDATFVTLLVRMDVLRHQ